MSEIQVHFGSFMNYAIKFKQNENTFYIPTKKHTFKGEAYPISQLLFFEEASNNNIGKVDSTIDLEEAKSNISASSNWGAAFGVAGIIGESLIKGGKVTFIAGFKDGRKILATTEAKTYNHIKSNFNSLKKIENK